MRQLIGTLVELLVGIGHFGGGDGDGFGRSDHMVLDDPVEGDRIDITPEVVPFDQHLVPAPLGEQVHLSDRPGVLVTDLLEQCDEAVQDVLGGGGVEDVTAVVQPHLHALARDGGEHRRVVAGVTGVESGDAQAFTGQLQVSGVDRVVLQDDAGVEEVSHSGDLLDVGQADVVVGGERGLLGLEPVGQGAEGLGRVEGDAHGQCVDEEADHRLDAGNVRRATGDRHAEHDVVAPGELPQHGRPGRLQKGVERTAFRSALCDERGGELAGQGGGHPFGQVMAPAPADRGHQAGLLDTAEHLLPGSVRCRPVLLGQPAEVLAVGGDTGQRRSVAPGAVQLEQLGEQDGHRPAVEQDVMVGEHEAVLAGRQRDEREPQQRRTLQIEAAHPVLGEPPLPLRLTLLRGQSAEVGLGPRQRHFARNHLHRLVELLVQECRPEIRMPPQQSRRRLPHPVGIQRAFDVEHELDGVDVVRSLVVNRVEQQSLLQR
ncbi:hypothetical protein A3Q37_04844 [Streptomyces sp. PTY087I2]|nr:hypothetical protein A3Q37_04844 [Streptomyces sp. PTY087I2]